MKLDRNKMELIMARKKLSFSEIELDSGLSHQYIYRIFSVSDGRCRPKTIGFIADAMGVEVEEIIADE